MNDYKLCIDSSELAPEIQNILNTPTTTTLTLFYSLPFSKLRHKELIATSKGGCFFKYLI